MSGQVSTLTRQQKYFRTRENRNFSTVRSTEKRIFNLNLMEGGLMVAMAGLQVFIVKMFFTGGRKGKHDTSAAIDTHADSFQATSDLWRRPLYHRKPRKAQTIHIYAKPSHYHLCRYLYSSFSTLLPSSITMYSSPTIIFISLSTMKFS